MDTWTTPAAWPTVALQFVTFVGLIRRGRVRRVRLFPAYLVVAAVLNALTLMGCDFTRRWDYWLGAELALTLLGAAVVAEIAARVFAHLPRARRRLWSVLLLVALATLLAVWRAPGVAGESAPTSWLFTMVVEVLPRLAFGAAVACLATLALMARYRIPLDGVHRGVLVGLMLFLMLYAGPTASADTDAVGRFVMYHVAPVAYLAIVIMWGWMAWRRETPDEQYPPAEAEVVRRLQPWRQGG